MPGNRKENAAVAGLRDEHARVAGHEALVQKDVRTARDANERRSVGIDHAADRIDPGARGVEDHLRADAEFLARFLVLRRDRLNPAALALDPDHGHVVEGRGAEVVGRAHERDRQAGVVELPVIELHAAHEAFGLDARQARERLFAREAARAADAVAAVGHRRVDAQTHGEVFAFPLLVGRQNEGLRMNKVRSVLDEDAAFLERSEWA